MARQRKLPRPRLDVSGERQSVNVYIHTGLLRELDKRKARGEGRGKLIERALCKYLRVKL